jgi:hypothetical protein
MKEQQDGERLEQVRRAAAAEKERTRCRQRDRARWPLRPGERWTARQALARFILASDQFDLIKFSEEQPLTLEGTPWPVLHSPYSLKVEHVEWSAVEGFFSAVRPLLSVSEYRSLVEKSHRRFHPDRWRSRGLLATVHDVELRQELETAGNVVAQALTPIWIDSRK